MSWLSYPEPCGCGSWDCRKCYPKADDEGDPDAWKQEREYEATERAAGREVDSSRSGD